MSCEQRNKRGSRRVKFIYPVTFKIFSQDASSKVIRCLFKSISMKGATLQLNDKYGLVDSTAINARAKIELNIFQQEKVFLLARVRSIIETDPDHEHTCLVGIEFEDLEEWQEEILENILNLRDKEHKMIWNLLDRIQEQVPG